MWRSKGSVFLADIAQVDGAWALGRSQLVLMRRMSVHFSVDPVCIRFFAAWSRFEPKAAYTHLLTQRKWRHLTFRRRWALCGTWLGLYRLLGGVVRPPISATRTALQALGQPPPEKPIYALSIAC